MLAERSVGSDRAPEDDARLRHGRSDDVRIVAFLRRALVEEIAVGAPRFQSRFHRRSGDRQIEEAQRSLVSFQFSRHGYASPHRPLTAAMRSAVLSSCHAIAWRSTESRSVPSRSKIAAFGNSKSSVVEASKA